MTIERLRRALQVAGGDTGAEHLADVLWLAHQLPPPEPDIEPRAAPEPVRGFPIEATPRDDGPREPTVRHKEEPQRPEVREEIPAPTPSDVRTGAAPDARKPEVSALGAVPEMRRLYAPAPATLPAVGAIRVAVPDAPTLGDRLRYHRALRPLKRMVPARHGAVVDEEATAHLIADQGPGAKVWLPVLRAPKERWLSVVVVVDRNESMRLWDRLIAELVSTLAESGVFRDIRIWHMESARDGRPVVTVTPGAEPRDPAELIDPSGRQVALVVSDCVGAVWANGRAGVVLHRWASRTPVAILQPLPERLWQRTYVPTTPAIVSAPRPGARNSELRWEALEGMQGPHGDEPQTPVPVMQIDDQWLKRWTTFVATGAATTTALAFVSSSRVPVDVRDDDQGAPELLREFQAGASPTAVRLAGCLAMVTPYLPVMWHVHRAMPRRAARAHHLAEVLLSGLMRATDADRGWYEFVSPEVARGLLGFVSLSEAEMVRRISRQIEDLADRGGTGFVAYLEGDGADRLPANVRPFAILSPLGVSLLQRIEQTVRSWRTAPHVEPIEPLPTGSVMHLLHPHRRVVRLRSRDAMLDRLTQWCTGAGPPAFVLVGGGGAGKTRLGVELAARLTEIGWQTAIVGPADPLPALPPTDRPLLVVVDYAEVLGPDQLARLVDAAGAQPGIPPVRILLLARADGDWRQLQQQRFGYLDDSAVHRLDPLLPGAEARASAFTEAVDDFATALDQAGSAGLRWRTIAANVTRPDLGEPQYELPLNVAMAALVGLLDVGAQRGPTDEEVETALLRHEQGYWEATAFAHRISPPQGTRLSDLVAIAALYGAEMAGDARKVTSLALDRPATDDVVTSVVRWLHELYPGTGGRYLGQPAPDVLAERIAAESVLHDPRVLVDVVPDAAEDQITRALLVLGRAAERLPNVTAALTAALAARPDALVKHAASVANQLPDPSRRALSRAIGGAIHAAAVPVETLVEVITELGRHDSLFDGQELDVARALVSQYRRLSGYDRSFERHLGEALGKLAAMLDEADHIDEALRAAREELNIYERLTRNQPDALLARRAEASARYAAMLRAAGQHSLALEWITTSINVRRDLIDASRPGNLPSYVAALTMRARVLVGLERRPEALAALDEAATASRLYIDTGAADHLPVLADVLWLQAIIRSQLGDHPNAVTPAVRSVDLYRRLADADATFASRLASSLQAAALIYAALGRHGEALELAAEGVRLYRDQVDAESEGYRVVYANAVYLHAVQLYEVGHRDKVEGALRSAIELYDSLPREAAARYRSVRAQVLHDLALHLAEVGSLAAASEALTEAVAAYRDLTADDPMRFGLALADALAQLAEWLQTLGRLQEAVGCCNEAIDRYTRYGGDDARDALNAMYRRLADLWRALDDPVRAERFDEVADA
jgi:tetratricopeptide (TPR) repeat protein